MFEHFELARESRCCLIDPELFQGRVMNLGNTQCNCSVQSAAEDRCKFIRLSSEFLSDLGGPLAGRTLNQVCDAAHPSEDFFLKINATDQWLRTVIGHENLNPSVWAEAETWCNPIPDFHIHSNILPYDPYWSKLQATGDEASTRISFPSYLLKEALEENKTLKMKLLEWSNTGNKCDIQKHGRGRCEDNFLGEPRTSNLFWEIQAADVKLVKGLGGGISLVTWRGGRFIRKDSPTNIYEELKIMKRFSHPHIVYSFGELRDGKQSGSYFMEYMSSSLFGFIVDRVERSVGDNEPPFSRYDSVGVLLQIAEAVRHMHQENDVVHCDLKSLNILVSVINTSDSVEHYLVKVADFGSARLGSTSSSAEGFIPGARTTIYAAPEVLRTQRIDLPHKIDVYSFGIVAFEVLTGMNNIADYKRNAKEFKSGVIEGTVRPPLRAEVEKQKDQISLQSDDSPRQRNSFLDWIIRWFRPFFGANDQGASTSRNPN